jgi:hypothetical protein
VYWWEKIFNLVKSFHFYGGLVGKNALFDGSCPSSEESGTSYFCDITQGTRQNKAFVPYANL